VRDVAEGAALAFAIDGALTRIRDRAAEVGPGFEALGDAIARAARGGKRFRPSFGTPEQAGRDSDGDPREGKRTPLVAGIEGRIP
jgi:ATP phosphoribosyltransferase regulatory subunit HisZ